MKEGCPWERKYAPSNLWECQTDDYKIAEIEASEEFGAAELTEPAEEE